MIITALTLIALGFLVKVFPNLIAGYNTMSQRQKENVDIEGLSTFMRNALVLLGVVVIVGHYVLKWLALASALSYFVPGIILIGIALMVWKARKFDHNKEKLVDTRFKTVFTVIVVVFACGSLVYGMIPSKYELNNKRLKFSGAYGFELKTEEIESVALLVEAPIIKARTNGLGIGQVKKGFFNVDGFGKTRLLIHAGRGPYLKITTIDKETIIINFKEKEKTTHIYHAVKSVREMD
ncbi:DUF3784 domain-containing protein [Belliella sp. DSM 111904]|uniref:DUF3784 domain-containing protein n=1 Tax=Belliella filtrata TaxID=2923435 RepID=A0ABS9UZ88_9BACT|nr:DUF3784 domain-containing protein [Belliella filtrata]MCH7409481.1 DUF3784 domain-containing protein [Belliella filtrata]